MNNCNVFIYFVILIISFWPECSFENITEKAETLITDDQQYTISLKNYNRDDTKAQEFTQRNSLSANENVTFTINDIPDVVSFVIVQIHTLQYEVSISDDKNSMPPSNKNISGTNIGFFVDTIGKTSINVYVMNNNTKIVETLFVVVAYRSDAPVPGGCNMEFDLEISPFQKVIVTDAMVIVDAQPASEPIKKKVTCEKNMVQHEAYRFYLSVQDFSSKSYFSVIEKMLTPENVMKNGEKIPAASIGSSMRRVYSAYPGIGSAYAMIATYKNQSAAYIPAFTFACTSSFEKDWCSMLPNGVSKTICALMIFFGLYLIFLGHKTPNTAIFVFSCLGGGLIGHICALSVGTHSPSNTMWIAIGSGLSIACVWQMFTCCLSEGGSKFFSILTLAFFFSCITYYKLPDRALPFENGFYFWGFFCSLTFLLVILIYTTFCLSSIFYCSILGSYLLIVALDYYIGSNLKYIIINIVRRITVPGFEFAVIDPPYGSEEMALTAFWVIFALISFFIQLRFCCGGRNESSEMTIPLAYRDGYGTVNFTPWRDIFKAHRDLRRSLRNSDR